MSQPNRRGLLPIMLIAAVAVVISTAKLGLNGYYPQVRAATVSYYVSPSGSDSATGSLTAPFRTVARGISQLKPGDTLYLRTGLYREQVNISVAGTAAARITVKSYPNEHAVIDGTGTGVADKNALIEILPTAQYFTLAGVGVQNSGGRGITNRGNHIRLEGLKITNILQQGINNRGTDGTEIVDSEVWNTITDNAAHDGIKNWGSAVSVWESTNTLISGNRVHDNHGEGINSWKSTDGTKILHNVVYDNYSTDVYLDGAKNSLVEGNLIYETETAYKPWANVGTARELATGLSIAQEDYTSQDPSYSCTSGGNRLINDIVRNNIIVNTRNGLNFYKYMPCNGWKNFRIENNTIYNTWDDGIRMWAGEHSGNVFRNNIIYPRQGKALEIDTPNDTKFEANLFYASQGQTAALFGWNGKTYSYTTWSVLPGITQARWGDPKLGSDYRLQTGSPAIDAGTVSGAVVDFWGVTRPVQTAFDIGAHEYGGVPVTPTNTPAVSPTQPACAMTSVGDADCNGAVDMVDYEIFRKQYMKEAPGTSADFNRDGSIGLGDFEIWRRGFYAHI